MKKAKKTYKKSETRVAYSFLLPTILVFLVFVIIPIIASIGLSFSKWNFLSGLKGIKFIGIANYKKLFKDIHFTSALKNTFFYTITTVPLTIIISLVLAYVLNGKVYAKKVLRTLFFIPYVCSAVAVAVVFKVLFRADGPINMFLQNTFGMTELPQWFVDPALNKIPIIIFVVWTSIGYGLIIYTAALQNVSTSLYEAAQLDGANSWQTFIHITVPMISPTTFYLLIIRMIAVFKIFTSINVMTLNNVNLSNTSIVCEIFDQAFGNYNFGYASAEAIVLFVLIMIVTIVNFIGQKKWVNY